MGWLAVQGQAWYRGRQGRGQVALTEAGVRDAQGAWDLLCCRASASQHAAPPAFTRPHFSTRCPLLATLLAPQPADQAPLHATPCLRACSQRANPLRGWAPPEHRVPLLRPVWGAASRQPAEPGAGTLLLHQVGPLPAAQVPAGGADGSVWAQFGSTAVHSLPLQRLLHRPLHL